MRLEIQAQQPRTFYFNSRTHVECDVLPWVVRQNRPLFQLTHSRGVRPGRIGTCRQKLEFQLTHSRGVRRAVRNNLKHWGNFNSRTHVECDMNTLKIQMEIMKFQLTHSRGVRHWKWGRRNRNRQFQLTHSRGVRLIGWNGGMGYDEFQLTHSRGVRPARHWIPWFPG